MGARRGELFLRVAAGYVKVGKDRIDKSPDQRVQEAVALVFAKFSEFRSVRQVLIWLVEEGIKLPVRGRNPEAQGVVWRTPAYNTVHNILTNPIYAGAYVFGHRQPGERGGGPQVRPARIAARAAGLARST